MVFLLVFFLNPSTNIAPVGGYLEDHFPIVGTPHVRGSEDTPWTKADPFWVGIYPSPGWRGSRHRRHPGPPPRGASAPGSCEPSTPADTLARK